jgi:2-methylisocitrate lyase-like PEP mutase family enzyme
MAPGLPDLDAVKAVCGALTKPFNFMVGIPGKSFAKAHLEAAGVKRISLASSLYRSALTGFIGAAREAKDEGTFGYVDTLVAGAELVELMGG